jgi:hypothetical protein
LVEVWTLGCDAKEIEHFHFYWMTHSLTRKKLMLYNGRNSNGVLHVEA